MTTQGDKHIIKLTDYLDALEKIAEARDSIDHWKVTTLTFYINDRAYYAQSVKDFYDEVHFACKMDGEKPVELEQLKTDLSHVRFESDAPHFFYDGLKVRMGEIE